MTSPYYDPLFDNWTIRLGFLAVVVVAGLVIAAGVWWHRSGRPYELIAVDLLVAGMLMWLVIARSLAKGAVTTARLLPTFVGVVAVVGAWSMARASSEAETREP